MSKPLSKSARGVSASSALPAPTSQRSVGNRFFGNLSSRLSYGRTGSMRTTSTLSARKNEANLDTDTKTETTKSARRYPNELNAPKHERVNAINSQRSVTRPSSASRLSDSRPTTRHHQASGSNSSRKDSNKENIGKVGGIGKMYEQIKTTTSARSYRSKVASTRSSKKDLQNISRAWPPPPHTNSPLSPNVEVTTEKTACRGEIGSKSTKHSLMTIISPRFAPAPAPAPAAAAVLTPLERLKDNPKDTFFRHEYVFFPKDQKLQTSLSSLKKESIQDTRQMLLCAGQKASKIACMVPLDLSRGLFNSTGSEPSHTDPVYEFDKGAVAYVDTGEDDDLPAKVQVAKDKLAKVESDVNHYNEALYQLETERNMKESVLKELRRQVENYEECDVTARSTCRRLEDQYRSQYELSVLCDMTEDRKILLERTQKRRDCLNVQWNQLQLLHQEVTPHISSEPCSESESSMKEVDEMVELEAEGARLGQASDQGAKDTTLTPVKSPERPGSNAVSDKLELSPFSDATCDVLRRFLAELLLEVEGLTMICIQVPSSSDSVCVGPTKGYEEGTSTKGSNGFFSFFGGATEQNLSAKPLSTLLSGTSWLERSAWRMEEEVQLRARELADPGEEEELREKLHLAPFLVNTTLISPHSELLASPTLQIDRNSSPQTPARDPASFSSDVTPPHANFQKMQLSNSPELLPRSPIQARTIVVAAARDIIESHASSCAKAVVPTASQTAAADSIKPRQLSYAYPRLRDVSQDMDLQQLQIFVNHKKEVEKQRSRARMLAKKFREAYKVQIEPDLRARIAELRQQLLNMTYEFKNLGVAEVRLEWKGQWASKGDSGVTDRFDSTDEARHMGKVKRQEAGKIPQTTRSDALYSSIGSTNDPNNIPSIPDIDSGLTSPFSKTQKQPRLVHCVTLRTLEVPAHSRPTPPYGESLYSISVGSTQQPQKLKESKSHVTAAWPLSITSAPSSCSEVCSDKICEVSSVRCSAPAINNFALCDLSAASAGGQNFGELPSFSSRTQVFLRPTLGVAMRSENQESLITNSAPDCSLQSLPLISKALLSVNNPHRATSLLCSPRKSGRLLSDSISASARSISKSLGPFPEPSSCGAIASTQANLSASKIPNFVEETFEPHGPSAQDVQNHLWGVHPDHRPDIQLERGAVKASLLFYGEEAKCRRIRETRNIERSRELWRLREDLARIEEDAFNQRQLLDELETRYLSQKREHKDSLEDAENKLQDSRQFLSALEQEYAEWDTIRQELDSLLNS